MNNVLANSSHRKNSTITIQRLRRVQAVAGIAFFMFLILHLGNTLLAALGPIPYNNYQQLLQGYYQNPAIELTLVILPLFTHITVAIWLYYLRKRTSQKPALRQRLNSWAGVFLLLVVFGHMLATRGIGYWFDAPPGFAGISFTLWWVPAYFYPYYFLLFMAGLYHSYNGLALLLARAGLPKLHRNSMARYVVMITGATGVILSLLSFGGQIFDIHDPRDSNYARAYTALLEIDLDEPVE